MLWTMSDAPANPIPPAGGAFLLAQLGAHAAARYAERIAGLDLNPAQTGLLRLVAQEPGRSQQDLATLLGVVPSKIVGLVDSLESLRLVERRRSTTDRRNYALHLTDHGRATMADLRTVAMEHDRDITAALNDEERVRLVELLQRVADQQGLRPGVHPGYQGLRRSSR
jgi:DNA-binding MarR family transcriptional regulator